MIGRHRLDCSSARGGSGISAGAVFRRHVPFFVIPFAIALLLADQACGNLWEAAPPTYHKIAISGRTLSDAMPQDITPTDQEPEQTYVDALTLRLRHATTDIFVPVATHLPELMVRRNAQGASWPAEGGLPPARRPDLPFGTGWTSGLAASIHRVEGKPGEPIYAEATDEQGMVHTFLEVLEPGRPLRFCPVSSPNNEQETTAMSLEKTGGNYVFRRKFGTTLVYTDAAKIELSGAGAKPGESPIKHTFFRLSTIENRAGSRISYVFHETNHGIIPDEIAYLTLRIHIERNARGHVARMVDPQGADILCEYRDSKLPEGGALLVRLRPQEIDGARAATFYDYDEASEPGGDGQPEFRHCDLSRITDPRGKIYVFDYEFDHSGAERGLPRCVRKVTLPDAIGTAEFFNLSRRKPDESQSVRMTYVRDAAGNGRLYRFLENRAVTLDATPAGTPGEKLAAPQFAVFGKMEISNFQGSDYHLSGSGDFVPGAGMKLLGREECAFDAGTCMGLTKATDLSGNVTRFSYGDGFAESAGMPANVFAAHRRDITEYVNALGGKKRFAYDRQTRLLTNAVDENGRVTENDVDGKRGVVTATRTYADGDSFTARRPCAATEYEFGDAVFPAFLTRKTIRKIPSANNPPWETDLVTKYEPDPLGRVAREIKNPGGMNLILRYGYDLNSNKLFKIYPDGYVILFTYDARNRLIRVERPQDDKPPRELYYDPTGNKIRETEPDGRVTDIEYDGESRVLARKVTEKDAAKGSKVFKFAYNGVNSKLFNTTDEGETYTMEFDGLQRATKIVSADGSESVFLYGPNCGSDLFENSTFKATRVTTSPSHQVTINAYDAIYRRVTATKTRAFSIFSEVSKFEYDAAGNLIQETAPGGNQTRYQYDPLNRLVRTVQPDKKVEETFYTSTGLKYATTDGTSGRVEKEYDAAGNVVEHTH
ncbi:MAG: hypothetical protein PHQ12_00100 [Chthoniobacteraceae bacterium]|nr:hypothetical protein [Chthoniobacteraceae bacterium]